MSIVLDIQTISVVIASASVIGSAIYYLIEIRHERKTRQTESIIRLSPWFSLSAKEIQEAISNVCSAEYTDYEDYLAKYSGKPQQISLKLLGNYFEGIGLLVHMKLVELDIVISFWGDVAESIWVNNEELINSMRKDLALCLRFNIGSFL